MKSNNRIYPPTYLCDNCGHKMDAHNNRGCQIFTCGRNCMVKNYMWGYFVALFHNRQGRFLQ